MRHVFIDESCQNAHQFMVLGALIVPGQIVKETEEAFEAELVRQGMSAELKWTKVSRAKLAAYQGSIDFYFNWLHPRGASFQALIVNCHELDHRTFNQGDPDLGFNKFLYQLLYQKVGKRFGDMERVVVDLDARNSTRHVTELQNVLNTTMIRDNGDPGRAPFARVAHRNSKSTRLLQLTDLLTGAIAWHKNSHDARPDCSAAKSALADHTARSVNLRRLGNSTSKSEDRLGVWNFALQRRGR
ncbi:Protein of unknown function [Pseudoxanthomonas sp. CF385]|uniref:DUF3800 domain-containing protein n=1 Tax=Pseudoxanthomonas sp. CF385 TaxID=1881042 RepID=UPI000886D04A|nr:DUF3800 domain-containing protein [Pseudoxanthomonas sp. CF385]SDQ31910.1 Protein of unknown function [Pseudoxanthomonas sp. CF385]